MEVEVAATEARVGTEVETEARAGPVPVATASGAAELGSCLVLRWSQLQLCQLKVLGL